MQALEDFEQVGPRGFYRPVRVLTLEQGIELVAKGIEHARERGLVDLVVTTCKLSGFAAPTPFGRYAFAVRWAEASAGKVRLAVVARPEMVDHEKIGMVMAQNRGLDAGTFVQEADAIKWLDARAGIRR